MASDRERANCIQRIAAEEYGVEPPIGVCIKIARTARRPRDGTSNDAFCAQLVLANRDLLCLTRSDMRATIGDALRTNAARTK